jgi:hypothetical protein
MSFDRLGARCSGARFPEAKQKPARDNPGRPVFVPSGPPTRLAETPASVERSSQQVRAPHVGHCSDSSNSAASGCAKRCARTAPLSRSRTSPCAPGRRPVRERIAARPRCCCRRVWALCSSCATRVPDERGGPMRPRVAFASTVRMPRGASREGACDPASGAFAARLAGLRVPR